MIPKNVNVNSELATEDTGAISFYNHATSKCCNYLDGIKTLARVFGVKNALTAIDEDNGLSILHHIVLFTASIVPEEKRNITEEIDLIISWIKLVMNGNNDDDSNQNYNIDKRRVLQRFSCRVDLKEGQWLHYWTMSPARFLLNIVAAPGRSSLQKMSSHNLTGTTKLLFFN